MTTDVATLVLRVNALEAQAARRNLDELARSGGNAKKVTDELKDAMKGLAAGLTVAAMVSYAKSAIDAADAMNDMRLKTGIAIKDLAAFDLVARQGGTTLEAMAQGFKFLGKYMTEHADKLKTIGVSSRDTKTAMMQFSDIIAGISDPALRSTLAMEVLGRSGVELIPALMGGSEALRTAMETTEGLGNALEVTAAQADQFNDQMEVLKTKGQEVGQGLMMSLLPSLNDILTAVAETQKESGLLSALWVGFGALGWAAIFRPITVLMLGLTNTIDEAIIRMYKFLRMDKVVDEMQTRVNQRYQQIAALAAEAEVQDTKNEASTKKLTKAQEDAIRTTIAAKQAKSDEAKAYDSWLEKLGSYTAKLEQENAQYRTLTENEKLDIELKQKLATGTIKLTAEERKRAEQKLAANKALEDANKAATEAAKREAEELKAAEEGLKQFQKEIVDAQYASMIATDQLVLSLQDEADTMQMSGQVKERYLALKKLEREYNAGLIPSMDDYLDRIKRINEAMDARDEASLRRGMSDLAESFNSELTDAFMRAFDSADGFAKSLRDSLTSMFKRMVLTPTINAIMAPISNAASGFLGSAAGSAAGGATGTGVVGAITGAVGAFGGAASSGYALAAGGNAMATWSAGAEMVASAQGLSSAAAGMGQMMGAAAQGLTTALAAIPVWGWVALAVIAATQMKGSYVKSTGYADMNFGAGSTSGTQNEWIDRHGGYNPVDMFVSPEAKSFVEGMQQAYINSAKSLGIGAAATTFGYSGNNADGGLSVVYGGTQGGAAYQSGEIKSADTAGFALASSRAIFAALQSSELPGYLAGVFNGLTASTASQAQIDGAMQFAAALKAVRDSLTETRTPLEILTETVNDGFKTLGTSAETFKTDFVAAIDAGMTPEGLANWQTLGANIDALATASGTASTEVDKVVRSLQDIASERANLQNQLDELTLTDAQMEAKRRGAIDESNLALYDQVQTAREAKVAVDALAKSQRESADAATAAANKEIARLAALNATNQKLSDQLDILTSKETARSIALRDAGDDSTRALMSAVWALEDLNDANDALALSAEKARAAFQGLQGAVDQFNLNAGNTTTLALAQGRQDSAWTELTTALPGIIESGFDQATTQGWLTTATQKELTAALGPAGIELAQRYLAAVNGVWSAQPKAQPQAQPSSGESSGDGGAAAALSKVASAFGEVGSAQKTYAGILTDTIKSLRSFRESLDKSDDPLRNLSLARAKFIGLSARVDAGDTSVNAELQSAAQDLLSLSRSYNSSDIGYMRDKAMVTSALDKVITTAEVSLADLPAEFSAALDPTKDALDALTTAITGYNALYAAGGRSSDPAPDLGPGNLATPGARAFNAANYRQGQSESVLVEAVRALRQEIVMLRSEARATAINTSDTNRKLDRVMPDGDALQTRAAT